MAADKQHFDVIHNPQAQRFEINLGDDFAVIDYRRSEGQIDLTHTGVPAAFKGQGIASKLARYALDYARANDLKVIPTCPFIAAYIRNHPEYQSLLADHNPATKE